MRPHALVVEKKSFNEVKSKTSKNVDLTLSREKLLELILEKLYSDDIIISTTGKTSRELFELIKNKNYQNPFFQLLDQWGIVAQ